MGSALLQLSLPRPRTLSPPSPRSAAGPSSSWCSCGGRTRPRWAPGWRWWIGRRWCQLLLAVSCRAAGGEDNINVAKKTLREKKRKGTRRERANEFSRPAAQLKKLLSHLRFNPVLLTDLAVATGYCVAGTVWTKTGQNSYFMTKKHQKNNLIN